MTFRTLLLAGSAAVLLASSPAMARNVGWYVGLSGGVSEVESANNVTVFPAGTPAAVTTVTNENWDMDTGWAAMLTAGYRWQSGLRVEVEGGYRHNEGIFRVGAIPLVGPLAPTELEEISLMANVFYEFPLSDKWTLSLGAGLGADQATLDSTFILASGSESDTVLAGQLIAQIGYQITQRLELFADYHYLVASHAAFENVIGPNIEENRFEIDKHAALIGLRYDLHADAPPVVYVPPAPPAAPPPPPPMRQFIVFFGFNKYNLTADAQAVVAEAASQAKSQGAASIMVVGHTDTSGGSAYNMRLSKMRATTVKDELMRQGIAAGQISATGRGEAELMVQTGDGVKEPQNRRATIDIK